MGDAVILDEARFLEVIDRAPLVSIDLVVVDPDQRVLCGWRVNQPARGFWFVPGGRILKGEALGVPGLTTHYVVLAYRLDVKSHPTPPDVQHSQYAWLSKSDSDTDPVRSSIHSNTAAYFHYL